MAKHFSAPDERLGTKKKSWIELEQAGLVRDTCNNTDMDLSVRLTLLI